MVYSYSQVGIRPKSKAIQPNIKSIPKGGITIAVSNFFLSKQSPD